MRRLMVLALALAGFVVNVPTTTSALPPDFVAPPLSITGTVRDELGNPLPGISITDAAFNFFTSTDAEGQYLVEGLVAGAEFVVTAFDPFGLHSQAESALVVVSDTAAAVADITMQTVVPTTISGTVTDVNGVPLGGIAVSEPFSTFGTTTTATDGTYVLGGLLPNQGYLIRATDPSGFHQEANADSVLVAADGSTVVNFTLLDAETSIVGTITDPDGNPIAGLSVTLSDFGITTSTGLDGRFAFPVVSEGSFTLFVDPSNVRPELRPVDVPVTVVAGITTDASVQLQRAASIDVTVTGGGAPAQGRVVLWTSTNQFVGSANTDASGSASVAVLTDGDYYVQVDSSDPAFASEFFPDTVLAANATRFSVAGEQHVAVAVDLEAAATVEGTISMPDGSPGDYTMVAAQPAGPTDVFTPLTACNLPQDGDAPGTFRIGCLHPSVDWFIKGFGQPTADNTYYRSSQSPFNATAIVVAPGQTVTGIDLRLAPKSPKLSISGMSQSYFLTGTTTAGVRIFGTGFPSDIHALTIDTSALGVGPGTFITVTRVVSATEVIATVRVEPGAIGPVPLASACFGGTTTGDFVEEFECFYRGDATTKVGTVNGRVVGPRGVAARGTSVRFTSTDGSISRTVFTDSQGRYSGTGLPPARYRVEFLGTETLKSEFWRNTTNAARATLVTVRAGRTERAIDAELARRGPITITAASPSRVQTDTASFDLLGTGLSSISGGFHVTASTPFGPRVLDSSSSSDTALRVTSFPFLLPVGTFDLRVEWAGNDGSVRGVTCVRCLTVASSMSLATSGIITPGTTSELTIFGSELVDIASVVVTGGTGVTVDSFALDEVGNLQVTVTAAPNAQGDPLSGGVIMTVTRADGLSGSAFFFIDPPV